MKHTTGFLVKRFEEFWGSAMLAAACHWPSSRCIPAQKFVSVSAELNHSRSLWTLDFVLSPVLFVFYNMNWIESHSWIGKVVAVSNCNIRRLLFANDLVLLASFEQGLQHALHWFSAACDQAGMKISIKKTEVLCLYRNLIQCMLKVSSNTVHCSRWSSSTPRGGIHEWRKAEQGAWYTDW